MANSLIRVHPAVTLRVLCLDETTVNVLAGVRALRTTSLAELETADPSLARARDDRSHREYAWTLKPVICLHTLEQEPDAPAVMYLDADLMFFGAASPVCDRLRESSIVLVPDRPLPPRAWTGAGVRVELGPLQAAQMGRFNGGMVAFRRDPSGLDALRWWRERCLDYCRDASVGGGHGDQWYLNEIAERFDRVGTVDHPGVGLAPWNARDTTFELVGRQPLADGEPVVFYHFQSLRFRRATLAARLASWCSNDLGPLAGVRPTIHAVMARHWRLPRLERQLLWQAYREELATAVRQLCAVDPAWLDTVPSESRIVLLGDVVAELRWRAYLLLGRTLPGPLRAVASRARARLVKVAGGQCQS